MGHLTRRSLLRSALAGGGALVAPGVTRALAAEPDGEIAELALRNGRPVRSPGLFDLVAVEWEAPARADVRLRVRRRAGGWSPWVDAPADHGHGPDRARPRLITDPVWAGDADD